MSEENNFKKVLILALDEGLEKGNKTYTRVQLVDCDHNITSNVGCFDITKKKRPYPGVVYEVEAELKDNGNISSLRSSTFKYIGAYKKKEHSAEIRTRQQSLETLITANKQAAKAKKDNSNIFEAMKPLRVAYNSTSAAGKLAIEVRLLHWLRYNKDL